MKASTLVIGGIAAYLLLKPKDAGAVHNLGGGVHSIGSFSQASMGQLEKVRNVATAISFGWTVATYDFKNMPLAWNYQLLVSLSASGVPTVDATAVAYIGRTNGTYSDTIRILSIPTTVPAGTIMTATVILQAALSSAVGVPTSSYTVLAAKNLAGAIVVRDETGPAVPGGNIGTITVAQRTRWMV